MMQSLCSSFCPWLLIAMVGTGRARGPSSPARCWSRRSRPGGLSASRFPSTITFDPDAEELAAWAVAITDPMLSRSNSRWLMTVGAGGSISEHNLKFWGYRQVGSEVEIRGPCYSACTLITAYVGKDKLCIAPGAFFGFHAVRTAKWPPEILPAETAVTYRQQPPEIRTWIDRHGGHDKLPLHGFSFLRRTATCGRWAARAAVVMRPWAGTKMA